MAQLSSTNAIAITDINNDNHADIIIGGNKFRFPPQFGRLDASYGDVLLNLGDGKFERVKPQVSGLDLRGEVRDIKVINGSNKRYLLVAINDELPRLYQLNN